MTAPRPDPAPPGRATGKCRGCRRVRPIVSKALHCCNACWMRWDRADRPTTIPPPGRPRRCSGCGKTKLIVAPSLGCCSACWRRWDRADRPATIPPPPARTPPPAPTGRPPRSRYRDRLEDYQWLTATGESPEMIAVRLRVRPSTVKTYASRVHTLPADDAFGRAA